MVMLSTIESKNQKSWFYLLTNSPHQHLFCFVQVSCMKKLHGHTSSRSFSESPVRNLQGQYISPNVFLKSINPFSKKSTCALSGFKINSCFVQKTSKSLRRDSISSAVIISSSSSLLQRKSLCMRFCSGTLGRPQAHSRRNVCHCKPCSDRIFYPY